MFEQAITGVVTINTWSGNTHTLTQANGTSDQARNAVLVLTGSPTAAVELICPAANKVYIVRNTLAFDATVKTSSGTGVVVPAGTTASVFCNGTDFFRSLNGLAPTVTIGGPLTGSTTSLGLNVNPTVQEDVTTRAVMYLSNPSTKAATFTLSALVGFRAEQGTFGANSKVTSQYGFNANSDLTGAQFNYGYFGALSSPSALTVQSVNGTGSTVTVDTTASHGLADGDSVVLSNIPDTLMTVGTYNGGPFTVTVVDSNTFTYNSTATSSASITSGNALKINNYNVYTGTAPSFFAGAVFARSNTTVPALAVRQTGTGNSFVVEDSSSDLTPFVIGPSGIVTVGATTPITGALFNVISSSGATINLGRNDGTVASGDLLGALEFYANGNTTRAWNDTAYIRALAGGTHADSDYPTFLSFGTTTVSGSAPVERLRITANGLTWMGFSSTASGTALSPTTPAVLYADTLTYTDTQTAGAGTVAHGTFISFDNSTLAATNVVTYTNASTVYIDGAPSAGTNVTITNPYALFVNAGATYLGGSVTVEGALTATGATTLNGNQTITTTSAGGATSLTIWNKGDSNASTTVQLIAQQAVSGGTPRNGGRIVFGRENGSAWTTTANADGFLGFQTVLNNADTERVRISSLGYVGINETNPSTFLHVTTSSTAAPVLIESTEAGAGAGPILDLYRNSASPAANDDLGGIYFYGNDSATPTANKTLYGSIVAEARSVVDGAEAGDILFFTNNAGTNSLAMRITSENRLGLGITEPQTLIDMAASNNGLLAATANNTLRFTDTDTSTANGQPIGKIEFFTSETDSPGPRVASYILSKAQGTAGGGDIRFATSTNTGAATEAMVLSGGGNLTVSGTLSAAGVAGNIYPSVYETVQAANAATETFTGIPSWVKKITIIFDRVSLSTADRVMVQIGDSGGIETTGYTGGSQVGGSNFAGDGTGYPVFFNDAARNYSGALALYNVTGNRWVLSGVLGRDDGFAVMCGGSKELSAVLTQLQITRFTGSTGVFDNGQFNILYE
jgi:hypothetical protein